MTEEYQGTFGSRNGRRPDPIPKNVKGAVCRVVKGTRNLNPTDKLVYEEILWLDQTEDGCFIRPDFLAERVGMSRDTVENARRRLKKAGLLINKPRPGYADAWVATLPVTLPSSKNPPVQEVQELTAALDFSMTEPGVQNTPMLVKDDHEPGVGNTAEFSQPGVRDYATIEDRDVVQREDRALSTELGIQGEKQLRENWKKEIGREPTDAEMDAFGLRTGTDG